MSEIVAEAYRWIGTPYVHQASVRGAGCDCLGLIRGVWRQVHGAEPEQAPHYSPDWGEPQGEELLWQAASRHMAQCADVDDWTLGQILLFRMREGSIAKHLGILSQAEPDPCFVHAYARHGVVESPLTDPWRRRIAARFEFQKR